MNTVADVVVDGLARAGTPRIFGVPGVGASLLAAARARGLPLVLAYGESAACVMAAVTGDLAAAPESTPTPASFRTRSATSPDGRPVPVMFGKT